MNDNLTEIIFLLDRSGSMGGLESDTIGGFNSFIKKQSEFGKTLITTVLFDNEYELLHDGLEATGINLTSKDYYVRGSTALLDAVGLTINNVGARLAATNEKKRPHIVIFVITTDGYENASKEFTYEKVNQMITHQTEKYNWEFIFLGANIDAAKESKKLGINRINSRSYVASKKGTEEMYSYLSDFSLEIRKDKSDS